MRSSPHRVRRGVHRRTRGGTQDSTADAESELLRRAAWQTTAWVLLLVLGGFYLFGATNDMIADGGAGIPTDHTGTFAAVAGTNWDLAQHTNPGTTAYITLVRCQNLQYRPWPGIS